IDTLCINQKNIPEKNHQVAQMWEIYLNAEAVAVWLGEQGNAQSAINLCRWLKGRGGSVLGKPSSLRRLF
ncbi:hypothetical protein F5882DRAFT_284950, partial [Hyaloscypha sp. PMI_1271]